MKLLPGHLRKVSALLALALSINVCLSLGSRAQTTHESKTTAPWPTNQWRTSTPREQGLREDLLAALVQRIRARQIRDLDSLLIVRHGYLVTEEYFNGWGPEQAHTLQSDSKSITSLLAGIAIQQGKIPDVNAKVLDYFPEYQPIKNLDARKSALRVQDLLTMRTGLNWSEANYATSPLFQLNNCQCDWLRFVLDWPMLEQPGTRFEYNSGGVILLGGLIRKATGMNVDAFAQQNLFAPLGITNAWWITGQPNNLPHTGGGLYMRPRDMAKIGYLLLRNGRWDGRQIVSTDWLRQSVQHQVISDRIFDSHFIDYGYLWWLLPLDGTGAAQGVEADIYTAAGANEQWIFAIPKYDLVVVVTGSAAANFGQPVEFLYTDILRAIDDRPINSVSAASYSNAPLAPESIAAAFGSNLASQGVAATTTPLPTSLAGASVIVRDNFGVERTAPLFYAGPNQINYQIPPDTAQGLATIIVTSGDGRVSIGTRQIASVSPGLFAVDATGTGIATAEVVRAKANGTQHYEQAFHYDPAQSRFIADPIDLGPDLGQATDQVFLILYGTGIRFRRALSTVSVTIGGETARVDYAGPQCCFVGLDQVNLLLPRSLIGRGEVNINLMVEGQVANTVTVHVK